KALQSLDCLPMMLSSRLVAATPCSLARDAYALELGPERSWPARARVNARRTHRIKAAFSRWRAARSTGPETWGISSQ
ncbi:hypothetical protein ABTA52_20705, partial [Acinetobacter baumannii]